MERFVLGAGAAGKAVRGLAFPDTQTFRPTGGWPMSHDPRSAGRSAGHAVGMRRGAKSFRSTTPLPASTS